MTNHFAGIPLKNQYQIYGSLWSSMWAFILTNFSLVSNTHRCNWLMRCWRLGMEWEARVQGAATSVTKLICFGNLSINTKKTLRICFGRKQRSSSWSYNLIGGYKTPRDCEIFLLWFQYLELYPAIEAGPHIFDPMFFLSLKYLGLLPLHVLSFFEILSLSFNFKSLSALYWIFNYISLFTPRLIVPEYRHHIFIFPEVLNLLSFNKCSAEWIKIKIAIICWAFTDSRHWTKCFVHIYTSYQPYRLHFIISQFCRWGNGGTEDWRILSSAM